MRIWTTLGVFLLAAAGTVYAGTAGNLDDAFGTNGLVVSDFGGFDNDLAFGAVAQADGKVVVVGGARFAVVDPEAEPLVVVDDDRFTVARYDLDGDLDTTFATNGWTTIALDDADEPGNAIAVALDADAKIVVVGTVTDLATRTVTTGRGKNQTTTEETVRDGTRVAVVRLDTDGTLDPAFDGDGIRLIDIAGCTDEIARSVQILADGDILIGGGGSFASGSSGGGKKGRKSSGSVSGGTFLVRLDDDGGFDSTFGDGAPVTHNADAANNGIAIHGMGIQASTGRIVALGLDDAVRAYDLDTGAVDSTFGSSGVVSAPEGDLWMRLVADDADETILVCGQRSGDGLVLRIDADGGDDDGGYVTSLTSNSHFNALGIDGLGRVVAGGHAEGDVFVLRLTADGSADTIFGPNGLGESTGTSGYEESALDLAIDGADVIVVGTAIVPNTSQDWFVARWCGTTDATGN